MKLSAPSHRRGFSLLEITAVLLVLGIASTIVLPAFGQHDDLKVASAAREMVADLASAQNQAIAEGRFIYISFDANRGTYKILGAIRPEKVLDRPSSDEAFEVNVGGGALHGVTIKSVTINKGTVLAFDSMGIPYAVDTTKVDPAPLDEATIVLGCGNETRQVVIQPMTGSIKVVE